MENTTKATLLGSRACRAAESSSSLNRGNAAPCAAASTAPLTTAAGVVTTTRNSVPGGSPASRPAPSPATNVAGAKPTTAASTVPPSMNPCPTSRSNPKAIGIETSTSIALIPATASQMSRPWSFRQVRRSSVTATA